jgi:Fe-S cluster assembly ATP-binding protein
MLVTQEFAIKVDDKIILDDMHLDFSPGIHIIMGPNGVGKSTFGHALMGNSKYTTEGAVQINGKDLLSMETHERSQAGLFLSFQQPTEIEGLSNFQFINQMLRNDSKENNLGVITTALSRYKSLAEKFNLPEGFDRKILNVEASGGEKKKNELIQLDMLDPQTAILDEPDSGLDIDAIKILVEKLRAFVDKGDKTLIIVSHYAELITKLNPDTVTILDKKGNAKQTEDIQVAYDILENGFNG